MVESLRTTQIAFFRFATPCGFFRVSADKVQKAPCKRNSYETICENIVSRYQTLVSSLPREAVFRSRRPKAHFMTGRTGSPVISSKIYARLFLSFEPNFLDKNPWVSDNQI